MRLSLTERRIRGPVWCRVARNPGARGERMVSESSADVYQEIFAGVSSRSDLAHAIARAVRQLREAMEKEDNCAVTAAHVRNLKEIDPAALALAYAMAEKTCTYW